MASDEQKPPADPDAETSATPHEWHERATDTGARLPAFPREIGAYSVQSILGSGAMGTVYLAQQHKPRRKVALKVMKPGIASSSALRRFEYESQILARLRHPGIAQVYEAGTHDGGSGAGPYFAMEYIPNAKPITEYADQKKLDTKERLELFAKVCDAVHHGHQKGIIHRDLKPGNILVDSGGQPKVIDFGVARATDSDMAVTTLQTDLGQLIGTLQYMSPEQCEADPHDMDTRSDVYSLGVILYELLCGQLPYDVSRAAIHEAARLVREETPPRPSTINRTLRGDVETITLKALEKERERRYQSAADLAQDVQHHLRDEPIVARPPSVIYQVKMFARRNRIVFAAMASTAAVLVLATIVSIFFSIQAKREATAARLAERESAETTQAFLAFKSLLRSYQDGPRQIFRSIQTIPNGKTRQDGALFAIIRTIHKETDNTWVWPPYTLALVNARGEEVKELSQKVKIPEQVSQSFADEYVTVVDDQFVIGDLLAEYQGSEFAVIVRNEHFYPSALQIHDAELGPDSRKRELWNEGHIQTFFSDAEYGLVCLATSQFLDRSVPALEGLERLPPKLKRAPMIVFAIQPDKLERSSSVLFPLQASGSRPLAVPDHILVLRPNVEAMLRSRYKIEVVQREFGSPDEASESLCRLRLRYVVFDEEWEETSDYVFDGHLETDGTVTGSFMRQLPASLKLPTPEFEVLDVGLLSDAQAKVHDLFEEKDWSLERVIEELKGELRRNPDSERFKAAHDLAVLREKHIGWHVDTAWHVIRDPDRLEEAYQRARTLLEGSRAGIDLVGPKLKERFHRTAGLAEYRDGEYRSALSALESAGDDDISTAACLAMTHLRIAEQVEALGVFADLVDLIRQSSNYSANPVEQRLVLEAESVLEESMQGLVSAAVAKDTGVVGIVGELIDLYDEWHGVEPNRNYDEKANEWRARLATDQ